MTGPVGYDLRQLAADDLAAVTTIEAAVNPHPWSYDLFRGELDLPPASRHWLVAETSPGPGPGRGEVVGFGGIMLVADTAHLLNIAVAPAHARRGLGGRLCHELMTAARQRGATGLTLEVRASNRPAIALYEKLGLTEAGTRPGYYTDGEDALIYWIHDLVEVCPT